MDIYVPDQKILDEKLANIKADGLSQLHIISDYDRTITQSYHNGVKIGSTVSLIRMGGYLGEEYSVEATKLAHHYHPIELDHSLTIEQRSVKMLEWWNGMIALKAKHGLSREIIDKVVSDHPPRFRPYYDEIMQFLRDNEIPMLVFSAGNGDLVERFLEKGKVFTDNVHVVSNYYAYDEHGKVTGWANEVIHTFSKNEVAIEKLPYYEEIKERKNVILLGDSIGDHHMADGLEHDVKLCIGFINDNVEENLEEYAKRFDVLILNDGTMEYVHNLLLELQGKA